MREVGNAEGIKGHLYEVTFNKFSNIKIFKTNKILTLKLHTELPSSPPSLYISKLPHAFRVKIYDFKVITNFQ